MSLQPTTAGMGSADAALRQNQLGAGYNVASPDVAGKQQCVKRNKQHQAIFRLIACGGWCACC
jgi:hypothetical protein